MAFTKGKGGLLKGVPPSTLVNHNTYMRFLRESFMMRRTWVCRPFGDSSVVEMIKVFHDLKNTN